MFTINGLLGRLHLAHTLYCKNISFHRIKYISMAMLRRPLGVFFYPYSVLLGVTYDCQFHCKFCGISQRQDIDKRLLLSSLEIKKLIKELAGLGVLHLGFTGGEPILREDIFELIAFASKKGMIVSLDSNGLAIDQESSLRLKQAGLSLLKISLHSPEPSRHDDITNYKGAFEKAISAAKSALSVGLSCIFSAVVTKELIKNEGLSRLKNIAKQAGAMGIKIAFPAFSGSLLRGTYPAFTPEEFNYIKEICDFRFMYYSSVLSHFLECSCLSKLNCYISPTGEVKVCMFLPGIFGSIKKENFKDIWRKMIHHPVYTYSSTDCYGVGQDFRKKYFSDNYSVEEGSYPIVANTKNAFKF